jgi:hypothetical protein
MDTPLTDRHLVLDLDSTLIHTSSNVKLYQQLALYSSPERARHRLRVYRTDLYNINGTGRSGTALPMWGIWRPFVFHFLNFCNLYFNCIYIWSAGQYKYVHRIKDLIFYDPRYSRTNRLRQPTAVLTFDDCEVGDTYLRKPLSNLYQISDATPEKTIIVDDNLLTAVNNRDNHIHIPAYEPPHSIEGIEETDVCLLQLLHWLCLPAVIDAPDVRLLDKSTIFSTPLETYPLLTKEQQYQVTW